MDTPLAELADALQRFRHGGVDERGPLGRHADGPARRAGPALPHRPARVRQHREGVPARSRTSTSSCQHIVYPPRQPRPARRQGAGLFLAARDRARARPSTRTLLGDIRLPRSWYIPSDGILDFIHHNDLEDVYNRKYVDIDQVRHEYPHIVQLFKNSLFSPEILRGLSRRPRRPRGPADHRAQLEPARGPAGLGLLGQVQEPLPRQHRHQARAPGRAARTRSPRSTPRSSAPTRSSTARERGLLDLHEEMGIMIQEVVGTRVGPYFLPAFSGVGFSATTSSAGRRGSGARTACCGIVPGLGTRAVDRAGRRLPGADRARPAGAARQRRRPTRSCATRRRRSTSSTSRPARFETVDVARAAARARRRVSRCCGRWSRSPTTTACAGRSGCSTSSTDGARRHLRGPASPTRRSSPACGRCCSVLREKLGTPVDIEFASDGQRPLPAAVPPAGQRPRAPRRRRSRATCPPTACSSPPAATSRTAASPTSRHVVYVDPRGYGAARRSTASAEVGPRGGPPEPAAAQAAVRADGPGPLGQPRRHPARRAASPTRTSATPRC